MTNFEKYFGTPEKLAFARIEMDGRLLGECSLLVSLCSMLDINRCTITHGYKEFYSECGELSATRDFLDWLKEEAVE